MHQCILMGTITVHSTDIATNVFTFQQKKVEWYKKIILKKYCKENKVTALNVTRNYKIQKL
jgi:hypothetical protein